MHLLLLTTYFACSKSEEEKSQQEDSAVDTGSGPVLSEFAVSWGENSVSLDLNIENSPDDAEYYWGIAETGVEEDPWTGEDCFRGYELDNGTIFNFCHPISETGAELFYAGNVFSLVEESETLFDLTNGDYQATTTHILDNRRGVDSPCWIWGNNPSYYDTSYGKPCTEM